MARPENDQAQDHRLKELSESQSITLTISKLQAEILSEHEVHTFIVCKKPSLL